ncbi:MAG: ribonuclease P protein component [Patescibacteria group bacterium]
MLSRKYRLVGVKNFTKVQKEGRVYQSQNFGIAVVDRHDDGPSRFAFIASIKVARDAVDRNRIKRVLGEAVRLSLFDIKNGYEMVFLAKPGITRIPTSDIMKEVRECLKASGFFL